MTQDALTPIDKHRSGDTPLQAKSAARRRRKAKPVPTLHMVMIRVACAVAASGGAGYLFAPADKASFFRDISLIALSFLFGKATNGFGGFSSTDADEKEDNP